MRFYFLSSRPCALKIGGVYAGLVGSADLFLDIPLDESVLCELIPTDPRFLPIGFLIDDDFLSDPPVETILCPTAILLKAERFFRADSTLRAIRQENYPDCTVTAFVQGTVQASWEREGEILTFPLTDDYENCRIERKEDCIFLLGNHHVTVISAEGKLLLSTPFIRYTLEEEFTLAIPRFDSMNHYAVDTYRLQNGWELIQSKLLFRKEARKELYLYALLESLLLDADVSEFITPELNERLEALKKFLGNYTSVLFITEEVAGLVYPVKGNLFRVTYFTAECEGEKIANLKEKEMET